MTEEIVLLAVTRMLSGFCIAGIDASGAWSRPVKRQASLALGDVSYRDRSLMQPFDRVRFDVERRLAAPPHVEDRICDFVRRRPERLGQLDTAQRAAFLDEHAEPDLAPILAHERSLGLTRADAASASFQIDPYSGKYDTRVQIPGVSDDRGFPCTDLRWRALGRRLLPQGGTLQLDADALCQRLGVQRIYVALGLARQFDGRHWPLVVGVHCVPDYEVVVDPKNP
jgi:hypothetical protein